MWTVIVYFIVTGKANWLVISKFLKFIKFVNINTIFKILTLLKKIIIWNLPDREEFYPDIFGGTKLRNKWPENDLQDRECEEREMENKVEISTLQRGSYVYDFNDEFKSRCRHKVFMVKNILPVLKIFFFSRILFFRQHSYHAPHFLSCFSICHSFRYSPLSCHSRLGETNWLTVTGG